MTPNEEARRRRLLRAARRGDRGARERLVGAYLPLVRTLAVGYRNNGLAFDDLVQEGCLGLLEAVDRYDARRSSDFEAFARFRIRRAIREALTQQSRAIRLPKHVIEHHRALDSTEAALVAEGERVTPQALAELTGLSVDTVMEVRGSTGSPLSLDEPLQPGGAPLSELVSGGDGDPETLLIAREEETALDAAVARLSVRQRRVVMAHWGLDGHQPRRLSSVAAELRLSRRRTQTISRDALHALRQDLEPLRP